MKQYENNKNYRKLSKNGKNVFDKIGSREFLFAYQSLNFNEKVRLTCAADHTSDFFNADGKRYEEEAVDEIKMDIRRSMQSMLFDLYTARDLFWAISDDQTGKTHVFRGKDDDGDKILGAYIFTDENAAERKIKECGIGDTCYAVAVDDAYDFIRHGINDCGYDFVRLFDKDSFVDFMYDDVFLDYNSYLSAKIDEFAQLRGTVDEKELDVLRSEISADYLYSQLFIPVTVTNNDVHVIMGRDGDGNGFLPAYTSFDECEKYNAEGEQGFVCLDVFDTTIISTRIEFPIIINPKSAAFVVDEKFLDSFERSIDDFQSFLVGDEDEFDEEYAECPPEMNASTGKRVKNK